MWRFGSEFIEAASLLSEARPDFLAIHLHVGGGRDTDAHFLATDAEDRQADAVLRHQNPLATATGQDKHGEASCWASYGHLLRASTHSFRLPDPLHSSGLRDLQSWVVPSGMIASDNSAPVKSAPSKQAPRKLASV